MNVNDILEIEQTKYCYEQAYAMHRHTGIPDLFVRAEDTVFSIPSASDMTLGWEAIRDKFSLDLDAVSPNEDSFHTGWQICTPLIWDDGPSGKVRGLFATFGYLVLSMSPVLFQPPYDVLATLELWQDGFEKTEDGWKINSLCAQFMMGQRIWRWDAAHDDSFATRHELHCVPHPFLSGKDT